MAFSPIAVITTALFLLSAGCEFSCNVGGKIDAKKLEQKIRDNFANEGGVIKSASCPTDVKTKEGERFTCEVIAENGDILKLEFDQTDGKGTVKIAQSDELVVMSKVVSGIEGMLKKNEVATKAGFSKVSCPPDKKAVKDAHFECTAEATDRKLFIGVDETDDKGNVTYAVAGIEVAPKALAGELAADLAGKKIKATVDCGSAPMKLVDQKVVTCSATNDKGEKALIEILPAGNLGGYKWRVK